jgi:ATP-dependent helicase/nuclease subunit A
LEVLRQRIAWRNPWPASATEPTKSNVTALRRRARDEDPEARVLFRARRAPGAGLSAADIGSAHHTFLQYVSLEQTGSLIGLRNEAERLCQEGYLARAEADALDYKALLRFWLSPLGQRVVQAAARVHRELPFTARFTAGELQALEIPALDTAPGDFLVVQGVIDLAVIDDHAIWLIDFKTDVFRAEAQPAKEREYAPQLRLYASALGRTYRRPVTEAWLHFFAPGRTVDVLASAKSGKKP